MKNPVHSPETPNEVQNLISKVLRLREARDTRLNYATISIAVGFGMIILVIVLRAEDMLWTVGVSLLVGVVMFIDGLRVRAKAQKIDVVLRGLNPELIPGTLR